ncbi:MAG: GxxExxY protein [bacterium]|jgi:GxxExxY protein
MTHNQTSSKIIEAAIKVHTALGPGLLESAYKECLYYELCLMGIRVLKEKPMPLMYEDVQLNIGYRLDLLVNDHVVVELKSVDAIHNIHMAQLLTYMKLGDYKLGLLINFNVTLLKYGIKRMINGLL